MSKALPHVHIEIQVPPILAGQVAGAFHQTYRSMPGGILHDYELDRYKHSDLQPLPDNHHLHVGAAGVLVRMFTSTLVSGAFAEAFLQKVNDIIRKHEDEAFAQPLKAVTR